jgi:nucleoside-diphosphate-sugar epimerase
MPLNDTQSNTNIRTILVTGSSGTIGTALCEAILDRELNLVGVDKVPNRWSPAVQSKTIIRDLTQPIPAGAFPGGVDLIVHLAANARVYLSVKNPQLAIENVLQTLNILEFARQASIPRFLFASSREVYGIQTNSFVGETQARIDGAESPYTASKVSGEAFGTAYRHSYGIATAAIRYSNVYGKFDDSERVVPSFIRQICKEQPLTIYGAGKTYDFTFVDDAVRGTLAVIDHFDSVVGETFNLATGRGNKILDVAQILQSILGKKPPISFAENRPGELMYYVADISKAKRLVGYEPRIALEDGLPLAVEWYKKCVNGEG